MNSPNSEKDPGGKTNQVRNGACPHDDGYAVSDLHRYLFCGQDRDKEPGRGYGQNSKGKGDHPGNPWIGIGGFWEGHNIPGH